MNLQVLPRALRKSLRAGRRRFEDKEGVEWEVEVEDGDALPEEIRNEYPNAVIFANSGVGDLLFLVPVEHGTDRLGQKVLIFRHEKSELEVLEEAVEELLATKKEKPSDHPTVTYHGSDEAVMPGDRVQIKLWLIVKKQGEVTYVPGISPKKPSMERNGLAWVGIELDSGDEVGTIVDPQSHELKKSVEKLAS